MKKLSLSLLIALIIASASVMLSAVEASAQNSFNGFISAGENHSMALLCDGTVWTWGERANGQLGDNTSGLGADQLVPVQVHGVGNIGFLTDITQVAAGRNHCLALRCDGRVLSWGTNTNGQLGDGTITQRNVPVLLPAFPFPAIAISAGGGETSGSGNAEGHSMALLSDGSVWTWGANDGGQLGNGSVAPNSTVPVQVLGIGGIGFLGSVIAISAGRNHSVCLLSNGTVVTFGSNTFDALGIGPGPDSNVPVQVLGVGGVGFLNNVVAISASQARHTLAVLSSGSVVAWGLGNDGQLGDGLSASSNVPVNVSGITTATEVATGALHSMVMLANGTVWASGRGIQGQIGDNALTNRPTPVQVHGIGNIGFLTSAISIAGGSFHNLAIVDSSGIGVLRSWGNNTSGQLGDNSITQRNVPVRVNGNLQVQLINASFTSTAPVCLGTNVTFTNTSTPTTGVTYLWNFGAGAAPATSTLINGPLAGVAYATAGTKTVTLIVSNGCSTCSDTAIQTIIIYDNANADFTSSAPGCVGQGVNFYNAGSTGGGAAHLWDFGSGATPATSALENPVGIIYSTSGAKTVTHTVTIGICGSVDVVTEIITINPVPTASFTSTAPQCTGNAVSFTNTGTTGTGVTYLWDFGAGASPATSVAQNPSGILYSTPGTKTITFTVKNQFGCTSTTTGTITINPTPVANFTSTAPACTGDSVNFTNTGTTGATYAWNFGSGASPATSTAENPSGVVYATAGIKTVTLITTLGTCTDTSIQTIDIKQTPAPAFTSNAPQCEGAAINLSYTGTTGLGWTFNWDFGTGATPATSSAQNPGSVIYTGAGTKTITLTVTNDICSQTITGTVTINPLPTADAGKDTVICANTSVQIGSNPQSGFTYNWFPTSMLSSSTIANPIASPVAPVTIYIVTMTNTATGCQAKDSIVVTMLSPLIANAGIDVEICLNDSIQIGAGLVEGQYYSWSPAIGLSNSSSPNPIASPGSTTTYTLTVTDTAGCSPVTDEVTVIVHPLPKADAGTDDTIMVGSSTQLIATGGVQYFWLPEKGLDNPNLFNPIASPDSTTDYVVTVTDLFGCVNTDTVRVVVFYYENPFWLPTAFTPDADGHNDILFVRGEVFQSFEFSIYNRTGEMLFYTKDMKRGWDGRRMSGEEMPVGAYIYHITGTLKDGTTVSVNDMVNLIR